MFSRELHKDRLILEKSQLSCHTGKITAIYKDKYLSNSILLRIYALQNNRLRIHLTEEKPLFQRFDVFKDAWATIREEPEIDESVDTLLDSFGNWCNLTFTNGNTVHVIFDKLQITLFDAKGSKLISFNDKNALIIEPHIGSIYTQENLENSNVDDNPDYLAVDESKENKFGDGEKQEHVAFETFDGATDTLPHGYQAVSFDAAFHNSKNVYGIPLHADSFSLNTHKSFYRLFNLDVFEFELYNGMALYGSAPFMVSSSVQGTIGLLFLNPSEMWISIEKEEQSSLFTFFDRTHKQESPINTHWVAESGNIDLFIMMGPTPKDVSFQYAQTTGFLSLPPIFALAYHQCRWNYESQRDVYEVDQNFDENLVPYDSIWLDIEHTVDRKYFTHDTFKFADFNQMIQNISLKGRKMITVVDPHVKQQSGYYVYDEAITNDFTIKTYSNDTYVGWCWPGNSIYPDYLNPKVREWYSHFFNTSIYKGSTQDLHTWVDMNEPSVFNGPEVTLPKDTKHGLWENRDIHNIYGQMCIDAAHQGGLVRSNGKLRPFTLSRSFFVGSQIYGAVWTGDNLASWDHLAITTPMLLSLNIAGISFSGADVAGFFGNPDSELFIRWYQLASMQPFFRGHSHIDTNRREPWSYGQPTTDIIRQQINRRYRYLPYLYTVFYEATKYGTPIMRPLWFEFPDDPETFNKEDSYLLGSSLLIRPIVAPGVTNVNFYLPFSHNVSICWWGLFDHMMYYSGYHTMPVPPIEELPMFQRCGSIIPTWERPRLTSSKMLNDPITLSIIVDSTGYAAGSFYIDDTATFDYKLGKFSLFTFSYINGTISGGTTGMYCSNIWLERVWIYGLKNKITSASVTSLGITTSLAVEQSGYSSMIRKPGAILSDGFVLRLSF